MIQPGLKNQEFHSLPSDLFELVDNTSYQCWTEGRSSTAVAEDLRPTATAPVAEV